MFGRRKESLGELIRSLHEESMSYSRRRDREVQESMSYSRQRDREVQESMSYSRQRDQEVQAYIEESRTNVEEFAEFNREILLRNEKVYTGVIRRLEELGEETRSNVEETRAQTQALLRVINRLDGLDGTGGTAAA
jgi:hypothetical protein